MDKNKVISAISELRNHPKRNFNQSVDVIINLKNMSVKQNPVDLFVTLSHKKGKDIKTVAFVDQSLREQANEVCDLVLGEDDFANYKDAKSIKKLAESYDYFIAQANLMAKVAGTFGKILGMKGKMPNPKLGCVVPGNANLESLKEKLAATVRLRARKGLNLQCLVGREDQSDEILADNVMAVYNAVLKVLPNEEQNVKSVQLKLTMGSPIKL